MNHYCQECGDQFALIEGNVNPDYCSDACEEKALAREDDTEVYDLSYGRRSGHVRDDF